MRNFILLILISIVIINCGKKSSTNPVEDFKFKVIQGPGSSDIQCLDFTVNNKLIVGTSNGVFLLDDDGTSWIPLNDSLSSSNIFAIKCLPNGTIMAGSYGGGVFRLPDLDQHWENTNSVSEISYILLSSNNTIFIASYNNGIYKSTDYSGTWTLSNPVGSYEMAESPTNKIWSGGKDLFYSSDDGINWDEIEIFSGTDNHIINITINSKNYIFFGSEYSGLYKSLDDGENWIRMTLDLPDTNSIFIEDIVFDNKNTLYTSEYYNGLYYSKDDGDSWNRIENDYITQPIRNLVIDKDGYLYACSARMVYILNPGKIID